MRLGFRTSRNHGEAPILYQYWDENPPADIASWMASWRGAEPEFQVRQFDDGMARGFVAEHIGPEAEAAYLECRAPAMKADLFRYCALYSTGGVYVDAGSSYHGGLAELFAKGKRGLFLRRTQGPGIKLINGFMIVKRAGDPLMKFVLESAIANIREKKSQSVWDVTGPGILRRAHSSEQKANLFSGFEILDMHSGPVRRVFAFQRREDKIGPLDWRRLRDSGETIYSDNSAAPAKLAILSRHGAERAGGKAQNLEQPISALTSKIAFLHIPKSGGVSVEQVLKSYFRREEIAPYYFPRDYAESRSPEELRAYRLFIGHFDYDLVERLDRDFLKIILIREPLQLVVSLYNHAGARPVHRLYAKISSGQLPFEKFCRVGGSVNILSKYLLGRSAYFALTATALSEESINRAIGIASNHLAQFDCVGMLDDMARFSQMLSTVTGIDASKIPRLNGSQPRRADINELTTAERRSLEDANRLDIAVYDAVRKIYEAGKRSGDGALS